MAARKALLVISAPTSDSFRPNFQAVRHKTRVYLSTSNFLHARPEFFKCLCLNCRRNGYGIASLSGYVFVANQASGTISVIETSTGQIVTTLTGGSLPTGIATDTSTSKVYVRNLNDNTITVIGIGPIP